MSKRCRCFDPSRCAQSDRASRLTTSLYFASATISVVAHFRGQERSSIQVLIADSEGLTARQSVRTLFTRGSGY